MSDMPHVSIRIGHGYDAHRLVSGRPLILGGVRIEHDKGLAGHSDADVLAHAVTDALLGAMGLGDMGRHFPSEEEQWRDADSLDLVRRARKMAEKVGGRAAQVDCTVYLEAPKLLPHFDEMRKQLGEALGLSPDRVSIKATTTDGMGFVGRGEGAAASAVMLVAVESR
jgi:2-C-methyl-D-erythritol 2,4-cyclodiphosphate synthase